MTRSGTGCATCPGAARRCASSASAPCSRPGGRPAKSLTGSPRSVRTRQTPANCSTTCADTGKWRNRLHYVRDFSYDEDRCRAAAGHLPQNLAALSNAAISIVRVTGPLRPHPRSQPALRRTPAGGARCGSEPRAQLTAPPAGPVSKITPTPPRGQRSSDRRPLTFSRRTRSRNARKFRRGPRNGRRRNQQAPRPGKPLPASPAPLPPAQPGGDFWIGLRAPRRCWPLVVKYGIRAHCGTTDDRRAGGHGSDHRQRVAGEVMRSGRVQAHAFPGNDESGGRRFDVPYRTRTLREAHSRPE